MKYSAIIILVFAVMQVFSEEAENEAAALELSAPEEARACLGLEKTCKEDCDCCGARYKCQFHLWGLAGSSCVYGTKYTCEEKRKKCTNPEAKAKC